MAKSRNKYTRARIRSKARRPKRRSGSGWFYGAMATIVVLGILGIVAFKGGSTSAEPPQPADQASGVAGDHWHAAFDVNICGEWIAPPNTFETVHDNPNVRSGIHTHGDGFIHIHPFTRSEGGSNAILGRFLDYGGFSVSEDSINLGDSTDAWPGLSVDPKQREWTDGDTCPEGTTYAGKKGVVKWSIDCKARSGDPSDVRLKDQQVIALAFLPKGESIGVPPNATATPSDDGSAAGLLDVPSCASVGPGGQTTDSTTATSVPAATDTTLTPSS